MKFQENYSVHWKLGLPPFWGRCVCGKCDVHGVGDFFHGYIPAKNSYLDISNLGHPIFRCGHLNPLQICVLLQLLRLQKTKRLPGCISMGPMDIDHVRHQHANRWCGRFVSSKNMLFSGSMLDHQGVKKKNIPYSSYESIKEPNRFHSK